MARTLVILFRFFPSTEEVYTWEVPSLVRTNASVLPSGDQAGELFDPLKLARIVRLPVASRWMKITGFPVSKET